MTVSPTAAAQLTGSVFVHRYALRGPLGRGGMGEVYEAADLRLDRTVAVKVLRAELAADRRFVARFEREARTAARLQHPAIVAVHDVGEDEGRVFTVLEHVPGRTLAQLLRERGPLPPARVSAIGAEVAEALAHAHARGVVHRDVAPGNVMVRDDGAVKVLDFGIARALLSSGRGGSVTAHGTIAYAAPEVLTGHAGDQRVDLYGLGAVLYELLIGRPPFSGSDEAAVTSRLRAELPPAPRTVLPSIPAGLEETILRCLARDPERREGDAGRLATELRRLAAFLPDTTEADDPRRLTGPVTARIVAPAATPALPVPAPSRRRLGRILAGILTVAVLAAGVLVAGPALLALRDPVTAHAQPPAALPGPASLTAISSCNGFVTAKVDLSWAPVSGADGYEVWRRSLSGEVWRKVTTVGGGTVAYEDVDLATSTTYVFHVRALDGPLPGHWSDVRSADTPFFCLA